MVKDMSKIVVSDVDGTIVKKSLVLNHASTLHDKGVIDLGDLPDMWRSDMKNEDLITELASNYRKQIIGKNTEQLLVDEYIAEVVSNDENFYSILDRLVEFKNNGVKVVLISGSPSYLVDKFADHYGFKSAGSRYITDSKGFFTGKVEGMFNGDAKRKYLTTLGLNRYADIFAFGDTQSDSPLFESASYSVLVEPNEETKTALGGMVQEIVMI